MLVQSQQFLPERVLNSTNSFLQSFFDETVMSAEFEGNFVNNVDILTQTLTKRDLNLKDKTDKIWSQILSGQNQFSFVDQQVKALKSLDVTEFRNFYRTQLLEASRRKLILVVYGKDKAFAPPAQYTIQYDQLDQTKDSLPLQHDETYM